VGNEVTLHEAAERLGVHYMTAYRYVRQGQLNATRTSAGWRVALDDLQQFSRPSAPAMRETQKGRARRHAPWALRLEARLIAGDVEGAWGVIESAMAAGSSVDRVYTEYITHAMESIGARWAAGELAVADEHRATVVVQRLLGRLGPHLNRRGRSSGTVVVGSPSGEHHSIPSAVVADLVRAEGWSVIDLGSDCPASSFTQVIKETDAVAVLLSVSHVDSFPAAAEVTAEVQAKQPQTLVITGGRAVSATADTDLDARLIPGRDIAQVLDMVRAHATRRRTV
jgi:MerR family transcriptional regulator, light-induced transcriptional regulator